MYRLKNSRRTNASTSKFQNFILTKHKFFFLVSASVAVARRRLPLDIDLQLGRTWLLTSHIISAHERVGRRFIAVHSCAQR
jgi:hypothetical protein